MTPAEEAHAERARAELVRAAQGCLLAYDLLEAAKRAREDGTVPAGTCDAAQRLAEGVLTEQSKMFRVAELVLRWHGIDVMGEARH